MKRQSVVLMMLALGLASAALGANPGDPPGAPDDHFLFYKAKVTSTYTPVTASIVNAFDASSTYTLKKPTNLCTPASKNGGTVTDSNTHLMAYSLKLTSGPGHVSCKGGNNSVCSIKVVDQFSTNPALRVDTVKPDLLLVPSSKTLMPPPDPSPDPNSISVDHYVCYKVKVTKNTPKFFPHKIKNGNPVSIADQFTTAKNYDVTKPKHLCVPTNVNGGGIKRASGYLMCYAAKVSKTSTPSSPHSGVNVNNEVQQAGPNTPLVLNTVKETELCAPAVINTVCGDNLKNDPSEQCDGTDDAACPGHCTPLCACPVPHTFTVDSMNSYVQVRGALGLDSDFTLSGFTGSITINTGGQITPGVLELSVPVTSLPPVDVLGQATACVFLTEDPALPGSGIAGTGVLNCFGSGINSPAVSPDFTFYRDHCTNGTSCDSHPTMSNCTSGLDGAPGKLHHKTGETDICVADAPEDPGCTTTDTFSGSTASDEDPNSPHPGVCNSPIYGRFGTTPNWTAGDAFMSVYVTVEIRPAGDMCTGPPSGTPIKGPLTTGVATSTMMDAFPSLAPAAGKVQALAIKGTPFTCSGATLPSTSGAVLVTAAPVLDVSLGLPNPAPPVADLNTILVLKAQ